MELFSAEFFSALLAIIVIDLVLAGDNAIVIALAARNLPPEHRNKAIMWGTVGAIVVRTAMTGVVVWLLKIPGLLAVGGTLLVWIAYKLLSDNDSGDEAHMDAAQNFWGAMKTIVVADALMGLDNVLAVAGAAHGNFILVVLGLLISIPIVIGGSQLILKFVERYPAIVYIGSGVLAWTAVKMVSGEPLLKPYIEAYPSAVWAAYVLVIGGVLLAGFLANHKETRARVSKHLVDFMSNDATPARPASVTRGDAEMKKVLIPVDGSRNSLKAVQHVVNRFVTNEPVEVHLLHVRTPLNQHTARFLNRRTRAAWHRDESEKALKPAREILEKFSVPFAAHTELGEKAEMINRVAQRVRADQIVMGTARKNSLTRMLEDSVTNSVLEIAQVPVEVIAGEHVSRMERYGLPAGIAAALAFVIATAD